MFGKVKLSKRQIKEDKFTAFMLNAKHHFMENWQYFIIGIVIVILIAVAIVYYFDSQKAQQIEAGNRYSDAIMSFRNGNNEDAILKLEQITKDFSSSKSAEQAVFQLANIHYENKNYPEATRFFEMYLNKYKDNKLFRSSSISGIASCMENQGNFAEAASKFQEAYNEFSESPSAGIYLESAMRNYLEVNDVENATIQLDKIKEDYSSTVLEINSIRLYTEKTQ